MSKFYGSSLDRVPNSGGSVQLIITTNHAHQTTSTPCKKVWMVANTKDIRVNIGSVCTDTTVGIPVSCFDTTLGFYLPLVIEIDDINELYFYGGANDAVIDILYRE